MKVVRTYKDKVRKDGVPRGRYLKIRVTSCKLLGAELVSRQNSGLFFSGSAVLKALCDSIHAFPAQHRAPSGPVPPLLSPPAPSSSLSSSARPCRLYRGANGRLRAFEALLGTSRPTEGPCSEVRRRPSFPTALHSSNPCPLHVHVHLRGPGSSSRRGCEPSIDQWSTGSSLDPRVARGWPVAPSKGAEEGAIAQQSQPKCASGWQAGADGGAIDGGAIDGGAPPPP